MIVLSLILNCDAACRGRGGAGGRGEEGDKGILPYLGRNTSMTIIWFSRLMMVSTLIGLLSAIFAPATLRMETEVGRRECG